MLALAEAEQRSAPTHLANFLEPDTLAACQASLDANELARAALADGRLSICTEDGIIYPDSHGEWVRLQQDNPPDQRGFAVNNVERDSLTVLGIRHTLQEIYSPRLVSVGAYVSRGGRVLPIHEDADLTIPLHLVGKKVLNFYTQVDGRPTGVTMKPGDAVVIPKGTLHQADTIENSIQLSVTVQEHGNERQQQLIEAQKSHEPTLLKDFLAPDELRACQDSLETEALINHGLRHGTLRTYHDNDMVTPATREEFDRLMRARDIPAFLAGNVADYSGAIGNVKSSLDNIYEPRATSMGLYVSEAGGAVLPIHSDAEDVAAIELVGDREVEYYTGPDSPPTVVKLNPGDALIIPAGVRHRTRALSSSAQLCYAIKTSDAYQNSPANIERRIDHASLGDLLDITVIDCTEDTQLIATDTSEINIPRADATHYVKFFLVHAIGVC